MISRIRRQARSLVVSGRPWLLGLGVAAFLAVLVACDGDPKTTMMLILIVMIWMLDFGWYKGAAVVPAAATVAAPVAQARQVLYLGAAAHVGGAAGTTWRTDCELLCIGETDCTVTLEALVHGLDNSVPNARTFEIPAGNARRIDDIIATEFGRDGKAALRVTSVAGAVIATNRTYNLLGAGNELGLPAGATFGQSIPAVRDQDAVAFGQEARLVQLSHGEVAGFRTNLGLVNLAPRNTAVEIDLHTADGTFLGTLSRTLKPFEYRQIGGVFELVTSDEVEGGHAVVRTTTEGARFLAQASIVDNATGDPVFVPARRVSGAAGGSAQPTRFIPAAAHIRGAADTNWRTDVVFHNAGDEAAQVTVDLLPHGGANPAPESRSFTVPAGRSLAYGDILVSLFDTDDKAALRIHATGGELVVSSRTFNLIGASKALPAGATFGQYIPAISEAEAIRAGDTGVLAQLTESADDHAGFRTNLALVNATDDEIVVTATAHAADGTDLGAFDITLGALEYRQVNSVFGAVSAGGVADGYLEVATSTDGGAFFALASVVDNVTGDPVGMIHARVLAPSAAGFVDVAGDVFDVLGGAVGPDGERLGLPGLVEVIQSGNVDDMLEAATESIPGAVASGGVLTTDYGAGWTDGDGAVHTGTSRLDLSGLTVTAGVLDGLIVEDHSAHFIDGEPAPYASLEVDLDLVVDGHGDVFGVVDVTGTGAAKTAGRSIQGSMDIDTLLCRYYPVGGSISLNDGDDSTTITFTPDCDGTFDYANGTRWDFEWITTDPYQNVAQEYFWETENLVIRTDGGFHFWQPMVGGETFEATDPAVVVYRFQLGHRILAARAGFPVHTFHWDYSRGHAFVYGSKEGINWILLDESPPPIWGGYSRAAANMEIPEELLGGHDLWIRVELYSWGSGAPDGGALTNTAQLCRFNPASPGVTAWLQADLEN
jgi:hypothetical protein